MANQYTQNPRREVRQCAQCGQEFVRMLSRLKPGHGIFCSRQCHIKSQGDGARTITYCTCGEPKQRRAAQCRGCVLRANQVKSALSRSQDHDFTPVDLPRSLGGPWDMGSYITGLWDGEGSFTAGFGTYSSGQRYASVTARLALRADDEDLVRLIATYFSVGYVQYRRWSPEHPKAMPQFAWVCGSSKQLARAVIPHFDAYPPRGKKGREYPIWRQIVCEIASWRPALRKSDDCRERVEALIRDLRAIRVYDRSDCA